MALWGKKRSPDKTVLMLDIENGSVAGALARLSATEAPKLFGEKRVHIPVTHTRDASALATGVFEELQEVLRNASEVAARLRHHKETAPLGVIEKVATFVGAPWARPNLESGTPEFAAHMQEKLYKESIAYAGVVPMTFHTTIGAAAYSHRALNPQEENALLLNISGEVAELLLLLDGAAQAHATVPLGYRGAIRTLNTHGGYSEAEARSLLRLHTLAETEQKNEGLRAAEVHFAESVASAARDIVSDTPVRSLVVLTHDAMGEFFARALSEYEGMETLFPEGSSVRALRPERALPYVAAHAGVPDLYLLLDALFVDSETAPAA